MAGDWIKFETATPDKPEIWLIAGALDIDPDAVVGKLLRVWGWFDQHTENGNAPSVSKMLLDRLVGVPNFCKTVIEAGWMLENDGVISLSNFDRHNGETAKTRALTAKRVAKHKLKDGNGKVTQPALPKEEKILTTTPKSPAGTSGKNPSDKKTRQKKPAIEIQTFIDQCKADGEKVLPPGDPIFKYASSAGIPNDFLTLAWREFRDRMIGENRRQKDWRMTFRKYIRGNYLKLWWVNSDGVYELTTTGKQAENTQRSNAA